jgi:hypothetical protein
MAQGVLYTVGLHAVDGLNRFFYCHFASLADALQIKRRIEVNADTFKSEGKRLRADGAKILWNELKYKERRN